MGGGGSNGRILNGTERRGEERRKLGREGKKSGPPLRMDVDRIVR
jgi:hypothetical protein